MTPEAEKKRRELFEEKVELPPTVRWNEDQRCYTGANFWLAQFGWDAFNAALDAVEIVFPSHRDEKYQDYYDDVEGGSFNCSRYLSDVRNAITATGLGLRIK